MSNSASLTLMITAVTLITRLHSAAHAGDAALAVHAGRLMHERQEMHKVGMDTLALHPTHPLVATGGADRLVKLWPHQHQVCCYRVLPVHQLSPSSVLCCKRGH